MLMQHAFLRRELLLSFLALALVFLLFMFLIPSFGVRDFNGSWFGFRNFAAGLDPYFLTAKFPPSRQPPWSFLLFAPLYLLPLKFAGAAWILFNLLFLVAAAELTRAYFAPECARYALVYLAGVFFMPALVNVQLGQFSLFVTLVFILGIVLLARGCDRSSGICLAVTTLKPQCLYLVLLAIGLHLIVSRRFALILYGALTVMLLFLSTFLIAPHAPGYWMSAMSDFFFQMPATLAGVTRYVVLQRTGSLVSWPLFVFPCAGAVFVAIRTKLGKAFRFDDIPLFLALSLFLAPHAWLYDCSLFLPFFVALIAAVQYPRFSSRDRMRCYALLILAQLPMFLSSLVTRNSAAHFADPIFLWIAWKLLSPKVFSRTPGGASAGLPVVQ